MRKRLLHVALVVAAVHAGVVIADAVCVWQDSAGQRARREARVLTDDNLADVLADWSEWYGGECDCICVQGCDPDECECECACGHEDDAGE
ncbi:MAG TPA: hypothetical protein VGF17_20135 [Phytomonospora sp.]